MFKTEKEANENLKQKIIDMVNKRIDEIDNGVELCLFHNEIMNITKKKSFIYDK